MIERSRAHGRDGGAGTSYRLSWRCRIRWGARSSSLAPEDVFDAAHQGPHLRDHFLLHEIKAHGDQRHT